VVRRLGVEPSRPARMPGLQPDRGPSPSNDALLALLKIECLRPPDVSRLLFASELKGHIGDPHGNRNSREHYRSATSELKIKWSGLRDSNSRSAGGSRKPSLSAKPAQYFPKLLKNNR
jgi:hypothetical protein